jgi:aminopeptidase-like protein
MRNLFFFLLILPFSNIVYSHGHDLSHTWLGDIAAYKSVKILDIKNFKKSNLELSNDLFVDIEFIKTKLAEYSGKKSVRVGSKDVLISERKSTEGRELGRQFLKQEYEKLGFKVSFQEYGSFRKGSNFIAEKIGDDESKVLIISSHIDSVQNSGANDDGTGTISALAIAKALNKYRSKYTLRVLGFDQEEIGLVGSKAYVQSLKKNELIGDIQLEMMGTNSRKDGVFHVIDCDKDHSTFLTNSIAQAIVDNNIDLKVNKACTTRSDHAKFWDAGLPAVVLSENFFGGDSDKCYHKKCDILDSRIDFNYIEKITKAVAYSVKNLIEAY